MEISVIVFLCICLITDIKSKSINMVPILVWGILGLMWRSFSGVNLLDLGIGIIPGVLLIVISISTKKTIGIGDGLVFIITGIYLGFTKNVQILLISLFICSIISIFLLVIRKVKIKQEIPFMPFVFASYCLIQILS